jgi:hypothetical protein
MSYILKEQKYVVKEDDWLFGFWVF